MRLTIIRDDGVVGIDGKFKKIDLSSLPAGIRAVQWDGARGHIEYDDMSNTDLDSIAGFQGFIDAWGLLPPLPATPKPTPAEMKAAALNRLNIAYQAAVNAITAEYPKDEVESWTRQEAEARAWLKDSATVTPWLDNAAAERGIRKTELAARIIDKVNRFAPVHGALTGKRQKLRDQIAALGDAATQAQLDAIRW